MKIVVKMKRRREGKTDYKARIEMLKSNLPRIVFRKTNRYIIGSYVISKNAQDFVIVSVNSKELRKYGWNDYNAKNLTACYLSGFLLGKKIIKKDISKECILDIGLLRNIKGSKIYSFVKGLKESGIKIKCKEEMFPKEERIVKNKFFEYIKNKIENEFEGR
ncbi:MAG: 50S ribosomal protein L18 [Candidatus Pacearchaeota archaeon]